MMNTIKMFAKMVKGLASYRKFETKEEFWFWYWRQIPDSRYPNETLEESWDTFKWKLSFGELRSEIRMWWLVRFGKKEFGYSWTFLKDGYFIEDGKWFVPNDKSFCYGCVNITAELENDNPIFTKD